MLSTSHSPKSRSPDDSSVWSTSSNAVHAPGFRWEMLHPRYWVTWIAIGFVGGISLLPRIVCIKLGRALGDGFRMANQKRRDIVAVNLALCFPERTVEERESMLRRHFHTYGQSMLDTGRLWLRSADSFVGLVAYQGLESLIDEINQGGRCILIMPHSVAMEISGVPLSNQLPVCCMMKRQSNVVLDWMMTRGRSRFGARMILREHGLRPLLQAVRNNVVGIYVPDEDFGPDNSVFAPFFGVDTATLTTLGRMAKVSKATVRTCFGAVRDDGRGYDVEVGEPLANFPTGDREQDATAMNAALENAVRKAPEQYMWTFRLFKTRPHGEASPYEQRIGHTHSDSQ